MDAKRQKAFDFAQETVKQVLTLTTAFLAVTITFRTDIVGSGSGAPEVWLQSGWALFLASAILGICALGSLTGSLESQDRPSIYETGARGFAAAQQLTFLLGLTATVVFAVCAL